MTSEVAARQHPGLSCAPYHVTFEIVTIGHQKSTGVGYLLKIS